MMWIAPRPDTQPPDCLPVPRDLFPAVGLCSAAMRRVCTVLLAGGRPVAPRPLARLTPRPLRPRAWQAQPYTATYLTADTLFEEGMATLRDAHKDVDATTGPRPDQVKRAMALLKDATELDPTHGAAQGQYGLSLLMMSPDVEQRAAKGHLEAALRLMAADDEGLNTVRMGYGDALFTMGCVPEAVEQYRAALASEGDVVTRQRLYLRVVFCSMAACTPEDARTAFVELPPMLAQMEQGIQQLEKAIEEGVLDADVEIDHGEGQVERKSFRQYMYDSNVQTFQANFRRF